MAPRSQQHVLLALSPKLADRVLEVGAALQRFGLAVSTAADAAESLAACGLTSYDAVVFDLTLAEPLGLEVWLDKLKLISPQTAPLLLGGPEQLDALRLSCLRADGDYVLMPLSMGELRVRLQRLIEARELRVLAAPTPAAERAAFDELVGRSLAIERIRERVRKMAPLTSTVLITGESGVGKELIARAIHRASPRHDQSFLAINCSALPETLLETELFGHEKGAFSGALGMRKGKFELAERGTLFLDEIGDMDPFTQAKILRVLEEKEFMRVGGSRVIKVDVRLVAATNADLPARIADGTFREDLYYRLKVLTVEVPPLRERAEDIPELARAFIDKFCAHNRIPPRRLTDEVLRLLQAYRWPGNIRELRNTLESLIAMAPGDVIDVDDLPAALRGETGSGARGPRAMEPPAGSPDSMEDVEREAIRRALEDAGGNRTLAARRLRIGIRTLQRKVKRYGLDDVGRGPNAYRGN